VQENAAKLSFACEKLMYKVSECGGFRATVSPAGCCRRMLFAARKSAVERLPAKTVPNLPRISFEPKKYENF